MANKITQPEDQEMVQVPKAQLEGLLGRLESLENKGKTQKPKRVTERVALLRVHEGKPVVAYKNVRDVFEAEKNKNVSYMDIYVLDEAEIAGPVKVNYLKFLNDTNSVQVQIEKQDVEEKTVSQGVVKAQNPDPAKVTSKIWDSREIDLEVTQREYVATIKVLEGDLKDKVFRVPADALNV